MQVRMAHTRAALIIAMATVTKMTTAADATLYLQQNKEREKCHSRITLTLAERLGTRENTELKRCLRAENIHGKAFSVLDISYIDQSIGDSKFRESSEDSSLTSGAPTLAMSKQNNRIEFNASSFRQVQDKASRAIVDTLDGYTSK